MLGTHSHFLNNNLEVDTSSFFSAVLLVEPDCEYSSWLTETIQPYVGEIICTTSGAEAIEKLESCFVELVLLNFSLPDISGLNLLHTINYYRPGLPVIVISNSNSIEDAMQTMREGSWDCLIKSTSDAFCSRIESSIRLAAARKIQEMQELELRAERDAFCVAAQTAQDGLAVIGSSGIVSFSNGAFDDFCLCLGEIRRPEEPLNIVSLTAKHDQTLSRKIQNELSSRNKADYLWSSELKVDNPAETTDQEARFFEITLTSVTVGTIENLASSLASELRRHVIWVRDITDRKRREKLQRELISSTSHDLKGPLAAISCAAEFISDSEEGLSEAATQMIQRIYSCARKSLTQIEEFLTARRIEDGVLVIRPMWLKADELLNDIILDYSMMAKTKQHQLLFHPAGGIELYADKLALHRVIGNLVTNAIKYTPEGGTIILKAELVEGEAQISVSDNGPGIEATTRHKLFERYGRLAEHEKIEGTGLGLYIADNIVKAHNGHIDVHSKVGVGSTFVICLPSFCPEDRN